jgi:thiamine biosynthesis protein ThiS
MLKLKVNGTERETSASTVNELILELGFKPEIVIVEHNFEIIKKNAYDAKLSHGDNVELVRMIGGGSYE